MPPRHCAEILAEAVCVSACVCGCVCVDSCLLIQRLHLLPLIAVSCNKAGRGRRGVPLAAGRFGPQLIDPISTFLVFLLHNI